MLNIKLLEQQIIANGLIVKHGLYKKNETNESFSERLTKYINENA